VAQNVGTMSFQPNGRWGMLSTSSEVPPHV
jgi:hypothetical protein